MNRFAILAVLATVFLCDCPASAQARPQPAPALPIAPPPRPKLVSIVIRSIKPADDMVTASRGFVVSYGLTTSDLDAIRTMRGLAMVVPVQYIPSEVRYLERTADTRIVATVPDHAKLNRFDVAAGRFLTDKDDDEKRDVCVLSSNAAKKLFPSDDPLGKSITIRGHTFVVVGALKEQSTDAANDVYIPSKTSRARFGEIFVRSQGKRSAEKVQFHEIIIRAADQTDPAKVADAIREMLKERHPAKDWEVTTR